VVAGLHFRFQDGYGKIRNRSSGTGNASDSAADDDQFRFHGPCVSASASLLYDDFSSAL
jgi:hypothetical protein